MKHIYNQMSVACLIALLFLTLFAFFQSAHADIAVEQQAQAGKFKTFRFFATTTPATGQTYFATTTSATSTNMAAWTDSNTGAIDNGSFVIAGAQQIVLYFGRTGVNGNAGSTNFRIQTTRDGINWDDYNQLFQNLATSTTPTTVASVTISAATSTVVTAMNPQFNSFYAIRCIVMETTDGEHSCAASARW